MNCPPLSSPFSPVGTSSAVEDPSTALRLGLPKGRMQAGLDSLLSEAGLQVRQSDRRYRASLGLDDVETKILKPQNIVEMLHAGSRDLGFAGADWVAELDADLVEVLDTGLDPVQVVVAGPAALREGDQWPARPLTVASEYLRLARRWVDERGIDATLLRSYGATEVFPPEDADCIVDNTATGSTLRANGLTIFDVVMESSTRLYANPRSLDDPTKRRRIEDFALLLRSVLEARARVMVEINVPADKLEALVQVLPCMRQPTVASLHDEEGFAVKAAVLREQLPTLIPSLRAAGGSDLVISQPSQIVV